MLDQELDAGRSLFPRRLIAYLDHPLLAGLDETTVSAITARHACNYFAFTAHFETRVVNRATELLANGRAGVLLDSDIRFGAYKIYCDEAYHALYSFDVIRQLEAVSGVPSIEYDFSPFLAELDAVSEQTMPRSGTLPQLLQVVVFETLVTAILSEVPTDPDLVGLVRDTVRDHAKDEGRHHAFFAQVFRELWVRFDDDTRRMVARSLPGLIRRSLAPDLRPIRANLTAAGVSEPVVAEVLADVYPPRVVRRTAREQAGQSLRLFRSTGVLDLPEAVDAFGAEGLL